MVRLPAKNTALPHACILVDVGVTSEVPVTLPNLHLVSNCRYDLDACDIQEKYPDLFQVNLEVEVEPRDRPGREAPPWEGAGMRGLNPKILFSSREEQQDVLSKFGEILHCGHTYGAPCRGHPGDPVRGVKVLPFRALLSECRKPVGGDPVAPLAMHKLPVFLAGFFSIFCVRYS